MFPHVHSTATERVETKFGKYIFRKSGFELKRNGRQGFWPPDITVGLSTTIVEPTASFLRVLKLGHDWQHSPWQAMEYSARVHPWQNKLARVACVKGVMTSAACESLKTL